MKNDGGRNRDQQQIEILVPGLEGKVVTPTGLRLRDYAMRSFQFVRLGYVRGSEAQLSYTPGGLGIYSVNRASSGRGGQGVDASQEILQGLTLPKQAIGGKRRNWFLTVSEACNRRIRVQALQLAADLLKTSVG